MALNTKQRAHGENKCLRSIECVGPVLRSLERYVSIKTQGEWEQKDIYQCLIGMASERLSIHSFQNIASKRPCETSMWYHLGKLNMDHIIDVNNLILMEEVLDILPKGKKYMFAIDYTDDPYYGIINQLNQDYVVGDRPKKSTTTFYRYITLYLVERDRKITLAALPVKKTVSQLQYVKQLIDTINQTGLKIKILLLDRGFYSSEIFSYLHKTGIPYIMPVKKHSTEMKTLLSTSKRSKYAKYTMNKTKEPIELNIAISIQYYKGRYKKHGRLPLGYVVNNIDWKPNKIAKTYRRRFSIEASYRMRNIVRPRTTSKNPTIRYLLALISLLLKNVWVAIRWRHCTQQRRGPKRVELDVFRFDQYRLIIWSIIMKKLGFRSNIQTLRLKG